MTARIASIALMAVTLLFSGCARESGPYVARRPTIVLSPTRDAARFLIVSGLDDAALDSFAGLQGGRRHMALQVRVAEAPPAAPSISGEIIRRDSDLVFTPRYPFQPGVKYIARFDPAILQSPQTPVVTEFMIPAPPREPVARVIAIYPSADVLPENLLKFYIHFSGPMSRGEAYRHVHLLDDAGRPVPAPFLELGEELWNPQMTRFTLFFDPGRIKQGLASRQELGPALLSGRTYTLVIDEAWRDGEQRPLTQPTRKPFRAGPADSRQPDPSRWRITPPAPGSTQDLEILFDEPLDHSMLQRTLTVRDAGGRQITGKVSVARHERRWSLTPDAAWQSGRYVIAVETILEDAAGNSIARPFEVNLNQGTEPAGPAEIELAFNIGL